MAKVSKGLNLLRLLSTLQLVIHHLAKNNPAHASFLQPSTRRTPISKSLPLSEVNQQLQALPYKNCKILKQTCFAKVTCYLQHTHQSADITKKQQILLMKRRAVTSQILLASAFSNFLTSPSLAYADENDLDVIEKQCQNGAIAPEAAVPGAYQQICMTLPQRSFSLQSTGDKILIQQGGNVEAGVSGRTGIVLWNSGLLLARMLDQLATTLQKQQKNSGGKDSMLFQNQTVLELGSGTGLNAIVASRLGASYVYATDGNEQIVSLAKENLKLNDIDIDKGQAASLSWGWMDAFDYNGVADVVIGSDLTYNTNTWRSLADTMSTVLTSSTETRPGGYVLYLTCGHSGFTVDGEVDGFVTVARSTTSLELIPPGSKDYPFGNNINLDKILLSALTPAEQIILRNTGGVKVLIFRNKNVKRNRI